MTLPWAQRVTATTPLRSGMSWSATASTCNAPRPGPSGPTVSVLQDTLPGPRCLNASSRPATPFFLLTSRLSCRNFFSLQDGVTFWCGRYCGMGLRSGVGAVKTWAIRDTLRIPPCTLAFAIHGSGRSRIAQLSPAPASPLPVFGNKNRDVRSRVICYMNPAHTFLPGRRLCWPGPCATGMSHTSLQGRIHGVSRPAQPPTGHAPDVEHRRQPDFTVLVRSPSANTHPAHHDPTPDAAPACDTTNAGTRHCHASPPPG